MPRTHWPAAAAAAILAPALALAQPRDTDPARAPAALHLDTAGAANPRTPGGLVLSFYGGRSLTFDTDLDVRAPGGTSVRYDNVPLDDHSFDPPIFYGARIACWLDAAPNVGFCLDFTHAKVFADTTDPRPRRGTIAGEPVSADGPLGDALAAFELSHGLNTLTLNAMHRWFLGPGGSRDDSCLGRLQPYVGLGAGLSVSHVEAAAADALGAARTFEYQLTGPVAQGFVGANVDLARWDWASLSLFLEYKLAWTAVRADLADGATVRLAPWTSQFILGLSIEF